MTKKREPQPGDLLQVRMVEKPWRSWPAVVLPNGNYPGRYMVLHRQAVAEIVASPPRETKTEGADQ